MERSTHSILNTMKRLSATVIYKAGFYGVMTALVLGATACGKHDSSFSLLSDSATFQQNASEINGKIDILFVIDNSGSMDSSQKALATNIARFFEKFDSKGFDYQIAVTTTDAYKVNFGAAASQAKFRDGLDSTSHTGVFVVTPSTPNKQQVFVTNVLQSIYGSGDERAFSSMTAALDSSQNASFGFPRAGSFLSVIILSDEDDFSWNGSATIDNGNGYANASIDPVSKYVSYLDTKMSATASDRSSKYNVNAISIFDQSCLTQLNTGAQKVAQRYAALVDSTGGIKGSLCSDFGTTLSDISHKIIELRTRFYLASQPNPSTIVVSVNSANVPRIADGTPEPWNGFYYHTDDNSISFHGDYVPGPGAAIGVAFDPNGLR